MSEDELTAVDRALLHYLDDVDEYADRLRAEASRALTRAVRQAADFGWSQRRIAAAIGRSQPEVARLLRATRTPVVEYAVAMPAEAGGGDGAGSPEGPAQHEPQPASETAPGAEAQPADAAPTRPGHGSSTLTWVLRDKREEIVRIAAANGASHVRVFGSVARGEDDEHSDIDFLVDYAEDTGLFDMAGLQVELEEALRRPVDVANARSLWPRIARKALPEAVPL
ncbi:nucleotidyltransferase family protein [Cellulomonas denverensis]|nr:nucleotidyltransferase family protein [Cellulomonas denverensis]GIG26543.1 hypothetical protein Cde04nite_27870 [Cellulomonas denverensis]